MLYINGRFLTQEITGVQRFGIEVTKELDKICKKGEIEVLTPPGIINEIKLDNIKIKELGKRSNNIWTQWVLPRYVKKNRGELLTMSGMVPVLTPDYFVAHDTTFVRYPETFSKSFVASYTIDFKLSLKRCKKIFTISNFSKKELEKVFRIEDKIFEFVSPSSEHLLNTIYNETDLNKWGLQGKKYFLSVSSQTLHKNQLYIYNLARKYPNEIFVIVGGKPHTFSGYENGNAKNLIFTGYVSNDELYTLYKYGEGFIFPSLYEGFGLPPLEALTMGIRHIAVSDIEVFREIYNRNVYYFDPNDVEDFDINEMKKCRLNDQDVEYYLNSHSWKQTAKTIYDSIINRL